MAQGGPRTEGFDRLVSASVAVAGADGRSTVGVADVIEALLDQPGFDGHALLVDAGVDVGAARARQAHVRASRQDASDAIDEAIGDRPMRTPVLGADVKKLVASAMELCLASRQDLVGTEHIAVAVLLLPPDARTVLGAPPMRQHELVRRLRATASTRAHTGPGYEYLAHEIDRADETCRAGHSRAAFAALDQLTPFLADPAVLELAGEAALVRARAAAEVDGASFARTDRWAGEVVGAAGTPRLEVRLILVRASEALATGAAAAARAALDELRSRPPGIEPDAIDSVEADLRLLDGDVAGARRAVPPPTRRTERYVPLATARRVGQRATIALWAGEVDVAADLAQRALRFAEQGGRPASVLEAAGRVLAHAGSPVGWAPLDLIMRVAYENGEWRRWARAQFGLCVLAARTEPGPAADHGLARIAAQLDELGLMPVVLEARLEQARLAAAFGRVEDARRYLDDGLARAQALASAGWADRFARVRQELVGA